jgi:hypothetical protein
MKSRRFFVIKIRAPTPKQSLKIRKKGWICNMLHRTGSKGMFNASVIYRSAEKFESFYIWNQNSCSGSNDSTSSSPRRPVFRAKVARVDKLVVSHHLALAIRFSPANIHSTTAPEYAVVPALPHVVTTWVLYSASSYLALYLRTLGHRLFM